MPGADRGVRGQRQHRPRRDGRRRRNLDEEQLGHLHLGRCALGTGRRRAQQRDAVQPARLSAQVSVHDPRPGVAAHAGPADRRVDPARSGRPRRARRRAPDRTRDEGVPPRQDQRAEIHRRRRRLSALALRGLSRTQARCAQPHPAVDALSQRRFRRRRNRVLSPTAQDHAEDRQPADRTRRLHPYPSRQQAEACAQVHRDVVGVVPECGGAVRQCAARDELEPISKLLRSTSRTTAMQNAAPASCGFAHRTEIARNLCCDLPFLAATGGTPGRIAANGDHWIRTMRYSPGPLCGLMLTWIVVATAQATPRFPPGAIWNQDNSAKMIAASVGWGTGATHFQLDFSMHTLYDAGQSTTPTALVKEPGYYLPDCDTGLSVPLPAVGAIEGSSNYRCDIANNDCHLFVVDGNMLYESYQTMVDTSGLHSLCLVKWRLDLVYPQNGRGDGCTRADAAGFPMAPLLFGPDEVYAAMQGSGDLG